MGQSIAAQPAGWRQAGRPLLYAVDCRSGHQHNTTSIRSDGNLSLHPLMHEAKPGIGMQQVGITISNLSDCPSPSHGPTTFIRWLFQCKRPTSARHQTACIFGAGQKRHRFQRNQPSAEQKTGVGRHSDLHQCQTAMHLFKVLTLSTFISVKQPCTCLATEWMSVG